jgi:hypothetical protein
MSEHIESFDTLANLKKLAAEHAVQYIRSGMTVGLGTGSTSIFATRRVATLLGNGRLQDVVAFATSRATRNEAVRLKIPMMTDDLPRAFDVTIDGADEVDPHLDLIKGGGGALLREKLVAQVSGREIIVVDETKLSPRLGTRHACRGVALRPALAGALFGSFGCADCRAPAKWRVPYRSRKHNLRLRFWSIADVASLSQSLRRGRESSNTDSSSAWLIPSWLLAQRNSSVTRVMTHEPCETLFLRRL